MAVHLGRVWNFSLQTRPQRPLALRVAISTHTLFGGLRRKLTAVHTKVKVCIYISVSTTIHPGTGLQYCIKFMLIQPPDSFISFDTTFVVDSPPARIQHDSSAHRGNHRCLSPPRSPARSLDPETTKELPGDVSRRQLLHIARSE